MHFDFLKSRALAAALLAVVLLSAPQASAAAEKRLITETDLFDFKWIAGPQISPDGQHVVFVRVTVNEKKDGYDTALWIVGTDGKEPARQFTSGPRDGSPRWSPDGSRLAFARAVEKDGKPQPPQIYVISLAGGEAVAVTDLPRGAGGPVWSPDGRTLAFTSGANEKDLAKQAREKDKDKDKAKAKEGEEERESDVRVITQATYRFDGGGYDDPTRPNHIWTVAVPAPGAKASEPKQITQGEFDEGGMDWSPDGSLLYFVSNRVKEPYYVAPDADLYSVAAGGGEIRRVVSIDGGIEDFSLSPDGKRIAFVGTLNANPTRSHNQTDLFVVDAAPGATAKNLTVDYDGDVGAGLAADQHPPR
ncbi:MAG TPA: S9 family peptidase, partial [Thermoanaerobaculia bacterium]|nr:S9 family peptidase [Thermoanaerobaculia bacterium]